MERGHFDPFPNTDNGKAKSKRKTFKTVEYTSRTIKNCSNFVKNI
jgi:hypothetical protein